MRLGKLEKTIIKVLADNTCSWDCEQPHRFMDRSMAYGWLLERVVEEHYQTTDIEPRHRASFSRAVHALVDKGICTAWALGWHLITGRTGKGNVEHDFFVWQGGGKKGMGNSVLRPGETYSTPTPVYRRIKLDNWDKARELFGDDIGWCYIEEWIAINSKLTDNP